MVSQRRASYRAYHYFTEKNANKTTLLMYLKKDQLILAEKFRKKIL